MFAGVATLIGAWQQNGNRRANEAGFAGGLRLRQARRLASRPGRQPHTVRITFAALGAQAHVSRLGCIGRRGRLPRRRVLVPRCRARGRYGNCSARLGPSLRIKPQAQQHGEPRTTIEVIDNAFVGGIWQGGQMSRRPRLLVFPGDGEPRRFTHQLFRFPAKFHPPVVRELLERYTAPGDRVLDPFCGSGTLLVESIISGRNAIGTDLDPLAVFVSSVKARAIDPRRLVVRARELAERLEPLRRSAAEYEKLQWADISPAQFRRQGQRVSLPAIPNLGHWFRRYVSIDLARIRAEIMDMPISGAREALSSPVLCVDHSKRVECGLGTRVRLRGHIAYAAP